MSVIHPFLLLSRVLLYECTRVCFLFTHWWKIGVVSSLGQFWIRLLWTQVTMTLCGHIFFISLGKCIGVELMDYMLNIWLTIWETAKLFSKMAIPFYMPMKNICIPVAPYGCQCLVLPVFHFNQFNGCIVMSHVSSICLSVMNNLWRILSYAYKLLCTFFF